MDTARVKIIAIIAAVVTAALAFYYIRGVEESKPEEMTVIEAAQQIPAGTLIQQEMLKTVQIYASDLLPNAATSADQIVGKYAASEIYPDEQIPLSRASDESASSSAKSFSYKIPEGMRTVTISIDPTTSVAGMLQVGDHVDILATYNKVSSSADGESAGSQTVTKFIADDIEIAALDQTVVRSSSSDSSDSSSDGQTFTTVTMFVTPELAKAIVYENQNGSIVLTLRSPDETENPDHEEFTAESLNDF